MRDFQPPGQRLRQAGLPVRGNPLSLWSPGRFWQDIRLRTLRSGIRTTQPDFSEYGAGNAAHASKS